MRSSSLLIDHWILECFDHGDLVWARLDPTASLCGDSDEFEIIGVVCKLIYSCLNPV